LRLIKKFQIFSSKGKSECGLVEDLSLDEFVWRELLCWDRPTPAGVDKVAKKGWNIYPPPGGERG
jgi:hypothetical protein